MEVLAMLDCKKYLTDLGFGIISISLLIFYTEATPFFFPRTNGQQLEDLRIPLLLWNGRFSWKTSEVR